MAKSTAKRTRKFEKNHLKDTLEKRKAGAKIKQKEQLKAKTQLKKLKEKETDALLEEAAAAAPKKKDDKLAEMSVDDFFAGGFEIPKQLSKPVKKVGDKRKREIEEDDEDESDEGEGDDDDDDVSEVSFEEAPVADDDSDVDLDSEDDDDEQAMLRALEKNDPEVAKAYAKALKAEVPIGALSEDDEDEEPTPKKSKKEKKSKNKKAKLADELDNESSEDDEEIEDDIKDEAELTSAMVAKWSKAMSKQKSLRAMKEAVVAFRAAAHLNEDDDTSYKYTITSPEVYHELLHTVLQLVPEVLAHHLPVKESKNGTVVRVDTSSKKFKTLTPVLKSHTTSVQHLLTTLSDAPTLKLTLSSITPLLPHLLPFKKHLKTVVKTVVDIWSEASSSEATRITAFLVLRRLTVIGDPGLREAVLKTVYQGLIKGARNTSVHTIQGINLMKNSAAELWGIDSAVGYTTGFTFIRQLAIHLRSSITNNSKESYKTVYNWQYVHSLDFWARVLAEHCSPIKEAADGAQSQLRPLIYPTTQITLGALRLIPTASYFPLRFQLMRSLLRISRATGTYIPLAPALLEVLSSKEMKSAPKPSTLKPLDFATSYKAPKSYLRTRIYQDGVGEQVAELLSEFFVLWCTNIAFPELALPVIVMLKRWMKDASHKTSGNKNSKINSLLAVFVQKLEANGKWIEEKRSKVDFAPNNRAGVEGFLKGFEWEKTPLGAFVQGQRKQKEERTKILEVSRRQEEAKRKAEKEARGEDEAEMDDVVVSDDEDVEMGDESD